MPTPNLKKLLSGDYDQVKDRVSKGVAKRDYLKEQVVELEGKIKHLEEEKEDAEEARAFLQVVSEDTLKNLEFHLATLPTFALRSVDPTYPKQIAEVTTKRNQVEIQFLFDEEGNLDKPIDSAGGGCLGVAGLGTRLMVFALDQNRPTIILDEPLKGLSPDRHRNASSLLQRLTKDIGIQIIMVSHQDEIHAEADRVIKIVKKGRRSDVVL